MRVIEVCCMLLMLPLFSLGCFFRTQCIFADQFATYCNRIVSSKFLGFLFKLFFIYIQF